MLTLLADSVQNSFGDSGNAQTFVYSKFTYER